jgi:hypothetical protein
LTVDLFKQRALPESPVAAALLAVASEIVHSNTDKKLQLLLNKLLLQKLLSRQLLLQKLLLCFSSSWRTASAPTRPCSPAVRPPRALSRMHYSFILHFHSTQ